MRERRNSLPLSKRARLAIYLPQKNSAVNKRLRRAFEGEFLQTFGGCTVINSIKGLYLDSDGKCDTDKITLVYTDAPFDFDKNFGMLAAYADSLREAAKEATSEESILVVVQV